VLHARPEASHRTREPFQLGAEIYGHAGLEADLEVQDLALDSLRAAGLSGLVLDLADARLVRGLMTGVTTDATVLREVVEALAIKDSSRLEQLSAELPADTRAGLLALPQMYGDEQVLTEARKVLPARPLIHAALDDLAWLSNHVRRAHPDVTLGFDLADVGGHGYYSGVRFAAYAKGCADALLRGGRYDEIGAVFGRNRPAVGFSTDLKAISAVVAPEPRRMAVRAPWGEDASLRAAIRSLREQGDTVVCILPGHEHEGEEFDCDRELAAVDGRWVLRAL
jgi:ATP phosphoribosyltransferase regulatory subunit